VELGESFASEHAFHTLKYDFKPKSIDYDSVGRLSSDGRNIQVTLKTKQPDQATTDVQFNGHATECKKNSEFVLLFDAERKTFVLERLTSTIALKQNRGHQRKGADRVRNAGVRNVKKQLHGRSKRRKTDSKEVAGAAAAAEATVAAAAEDTVNENGAAAADDSSSSDSSSDSDSDGSSTSDDSANSTPVHGAAKAESQ